MPDTPDTLPPLYAFRCKSCGRLHTSDDAAEADHPHACCVCGAGVRFSPNGTKTIDPDNWEVLADADQERLDELGLDLEDIAEHQPWARGTGGSGAPPGRQAQGAVGVRAGDGPGTADGAG